MFINWICSSADLVFSDLFSDFWIAHILNGYTDPLTGEEMVLWLDKGRGGKRSSVLESDHLLSENENNGLGKHRWI